MAYTVQHLEPTKFILIEVSGESSTAELIDLFATLVERRGRLSGARIFCDVSAAAADVISWQVMIGAVDFLRAHQDRFAGMRWANYAAQPLHFGVSRMAGEMAIDLPFAYQAFTSREKALNWLAMPLDMRKALFPVPAVA
jgi:hypothetical protein